MKRHARFPLYVVITQIIAVSAAVITTLIVTGNPLALLGIILMPNNALSEWLAHVYQRPELEERHPAMGFLAPIGSEDIDDEDN